jgi:hypothetical protein
MMIKNREPIKAMICAIPQRSMQFCHGRVDETAFTPLNKAGLHHMNERVSSAPLMGVPEVI